MWDGGAHTTRIAPIHSALNLAARHRLLSPFHYPLKSVGDASEAITICGSRGGCCHAPIFIGSAFQIGDCEFGESFWDQLGHCDRLSTGADERAGAHVPLNHPWRGSAMVPSELATALAAFNPGAITMG